jgi:putative peptide zinc metalloprotease protein
MKRWVKVVFGLYILITIPLLVLLMFLMIKGVPHVLATAWDSLSALGGDFSAARESGDLLAMLSAVVQMALLALPTLGTIYVLYSLGRRLFTRLWMWSKPTAGRRAIGSAVTVTSLVLIAALWAPQLPLGTGKSGPLYASARERFTPITPDDRGTVAQAVPIFATQPTHTSNAGAQQTPTPASSNPAVVMTPTAPAHAAEPTPSPTPTGGPTPTPAPATQPNPTPTPVPAAAPGSRSNPTAVPGGAQPVPDGTQPTPVTLDPTPTPIPTVNQPTPGSNVQPTPMPTVAPTSTNRLLPTATSAP